MYKRAIWTKTNAMMKDDQKIGGRSLKWGVWQVGHLAKQAPVTCTLIAVTCWALPPKQEPLSNAVKRWGLNSHAQAKDKGRGTSLDGKGSSFGRSLKIDFADKMSEIVDREY